MVAIVEKTRMSWNMHTALLCLVLLWLYHQLLPCWMSLIHHVTQDFLTVDFCSFQTVTYIPFKKNIYTSLNHVWIFNVVKQDSQCAFICCNLKSWNTIHYSALLYLLYHSFNKPLALEAMWLCLYVWLTLQIHMSLCVYKCICQYSV